MAKRMTVESNLADVMAGISLLRDEVKEHKAVAAAAKQLAEREVNWLDRQVGGWKNAPDFKAKTTMQGKDFTLAILFDGRTKAGKVFRYVDEGTRPHTIQPKRPGYPLRFRTNYHPKSTVAGPFGSVGSGTATGPVVFRPSVRHPGTQARDFTGFVRDDMARQAPAMVQAQLRRVLTQVIKYSRRKRRRRH
jgi:hypothetical protein